MQNVQWGPPVDWHIGHGSLALSESVKYCYWEALHQTIQYYSLIQNFSSDYLLFDMRLPNFETDRHMKTKMVISTNHSLSLTIQIEGHEEFPILELKLDNIWNSNGTISRRSRDTSNIIKENNLFEKHVNLDNLIL